MFLLAGYKMKYADQISEIINAFSPAPLNSSQMNEFYCSNTMEYRMSDKYSSPIEDIFDMCQEQGENHNAFLLLGHRGCGKSTELNRMSEKLAERGYYVKTIICNMDLDLLNIVYSDLFILMGEALLEIAKECKCKIKKEILEEIKNFWDENTKTITSQQIKDTSGEIETSIETPKLISLLKIFADIKTDLKFNEEIRQEHRQKIRIRSSKWIALLRQVSEEITRKMEGKRPIIIFEDLDKLNPKDAWEVFYNYSALLSGMPFPVIYTFPIALSYDTKFSALEGYFITKTLPMIKIETIEGTVFQDGVDIIKEIVKKRANLHLFENGVLETLIEYTGGSLRDLFVVINSSAKRAERREDNVICMEDAERALAESKTFLTKRIEKKDYEFLLNIYRGNKEQVEDKEILLKMLQASVVFEYNGKRWHNVHPLVVRFFKEQGLI